MPRPELRRAETRAITSLQNERVKLIRSLEMRKVRRETGLFVAEGASVLVDGARRWLGPQMLVFLAGSAGNGIHRELLDVGAGGRRRMSGGLGGRARQARRQGQPADHARRVRAALGSRARRRQACAADALWVALEGVARSRQPRHDHPHRRCRRRRAASSWSAPAVDPYSREAVRASMGSVFNVPLVRITPERFVAWAASWQGDIVGTHLPRREDFRAVRYRAPTLLLMGSEGPGLSPALAAACTRLVKIPMAGRLDSLNLAVATALVLYEIRREKLKI